MLSYFALIAAETDTGRRGCIETEFGMYPKYDPALVNFKSLAKSALLHQSLRRDGEVKRPMNGKVLARNQGQPHELTLTTPRLHAVRSLQASGDPRLQGGHNQVWEDQHYALRGVEGDFEQRKHVLQLLFAATLIGLCLSAASPARALETTLQDPHGRVCGEESQLQVHTRNQRVQESRHPRWQGSSQEGPSSDVEPVFRRLYARDGTV